MSLEDLSTLKLLMVTLHPPFPSKKYYILENLFIIQLIYKFSSSKEMAIIKSSK